MEMADKERVQELQEQMKNMTSEEKIKLREERQKELDELMNFDKMWGIIIHWWMHFK